MGEVGIQLGGLFLVLVLLLVDVGLEAAVEIVDAQAGVDNGHRDQDQSNDSEKGHGIQGGEVKGHRFRVVHAIQLEAEVGHGSEEQELVGLVSSAIGIWMIGDLQ